MAKDLEGAIYHELRRIPADGEHMALLKAFQNAFSPFVLVNPRTMAERLVELLNRMGKEAKARGEKLLGFQEGF